MCGTALSKRLFVLDILQLACNQCWYGFVPSILCEFELSVCAEFCLISILVFLLMYIYICSFVFKSIFLLVICMICVLPLGVINDDDDDDNTSCRIYNGCKANEILLTQRNTKTPAKVLAAAQDVTPEPHTHTPTHRQTR